MVKGKLGGNIMKIGFIGCGSMGSAMIYSLQSSEHEIYAYDLDKKKVTYLTEKYDVLPMTTYGDITKLDVVFMAVEPGVVIKLAEELKELLKSKIVVSIAAGVKTERLLSILGASQKLVRAMPNAPALIKEGMTSLVFKNLSDEEKNLISEVFNHFGKTIELSERHFDAFTALCGSSPAFVFMFVESLANAGVLQGIPRELAYQMVAQTVMGSAKMLIEYDEHPAKLKDGVCSPNGATIEGVAELEKHNFRNALIQAAVRTGRKSEKMSEKY